MFSSHKLFQTVSCNLLVGYEIYLAGYDQHFLMSWNKRILECITPCRAKYLFLIFELQLHTIVCICLCGWVLT